MSTIDTAAEESPRLRRVTRESPLGTGLDWLLWFGTFLVCFVYGAYPTPDSNETHYLTKARHFWEPTWCNRDFFLQSQDAHAGFCWTVGWLTKIVELPVAAWLGRLLTWALLAWAWVRLGKRTLQQPGLIPLAAAGWFLLNDRYDMAGEWVIGGFEGKSLAMVCVVFALAELVIDRWTWVFPWLGAATFFHALAGGWAMLLAVAVWFIRGRRQAPWQEIFPPLMIGALLGLPAIWWGLRLNHGIDAATSATAARIYFERLPHHLNPLDVTFNLPRHAVLILVTAILFGALTGFPWSWLRGRVNHDYDPLQSDPLQAAYRNLGLFTLGAAGIAVVGLMLFNLLQSQPDSMYRLMRYYWFRASDAWIPLGCSLAAWRCVERLQVNFRPFAVAMGVALLVGTFLDLIVQLGHLPTPLPIIGTAQHESRADLRLEEWDPAEWRAICQWIRVHTPADALFLTPRTGRTFRWHAERAEVFTHKDIPQDAVGMLEWERRLNRLHPWVDGPEGTKVRLQSLALHGPVQLAALAREYKADYILVHYRAGMRELPWAYEARVGNFVLYRLDSGGIGASQPIITPPNLRP